jgi:hypothetical protein
MLLTNIVTTDQNKLGHLEWAIHSRHSNQRCALRLLALFEKYETTWKTQKPSRAAQDLMAVAFSLWRAAFLADKSGSRQMVFAHGKDFLERLIEDNAISYIQDKTAREWTFNYYTRNARSSLQVLRQYWPDEVPAYVGAKRTATERWDYCQQLLDQAVAGFEKRMESLRRKAEQVKERRIRRGKKKKQRAIVRKMKFASKVYGTP